DRIDDEAGRELTAQGFLPHSPTFKLGRPLLNEVFHVRPHLALPEITAPTLVVHGTRDRFIPVESSREAVGHLRSAARLGEMDGAQHGFAVHDWVTYHCGSQSLFDVSGMTGQATEWAAPGSPTAPPGPRGPES